MDRTARCPPGAAAQPRRARRCAAAGRAVAGAGRRALALRQPSQGVDQRAPRRRGRGPRGLHRLPSTARALHLRPGQRCHRRGVGGPGHDPAVRPPPTDDLPTCAGPRIPDDPDRLAAFEHEARCALAHTEAETLAEDRARYRRFATHTRHRAATQAERLLLAASGVRVQPGELFTRVTWTDGSRTRTWRRQPVVAVDEVAS